MIAKVQLIGSPFEIYHLLCKQLTVYTLPVVSSIFTRHGQVLGEKKHHGNIRSFPSSTALSHFWDTPLKFNMELEHPPPFSKEIPSWKPSFSGWWFQTFFIFTPILGEMIQFDEHIFQMGGSTTNYPKAPDPSYGNTRPS